MVVARRTTVSTEDYLKTFAATAVTLGVIAVLTWLLGKQFFDTLSSQIDLKLEILRRLNHRR